MPEILRKIELAKPDVAINYIGASFDLAATIAEKYGLDIRGNPEILGQVYHSFTPNEWLTHMSKKPANEPFTIVPGTMGKWIQILPSGFSRFITDEMIQRSNPGHWDTKLGRLTNVPNPR